MFLVFYKVYVYVNFIVKSIEIINKCAFSKRFNYNKINIDS